MFDLRVVSLAVFAASFAFGFAIFEASKIQHSNQEGDMQLTMTPLFGQHN